MSRHSFGRAAAVCGLVFISMSAFAASDATTAFRANIRLKAEFLARAGDLADTNGASAKIRSFARSQKDEQFGVIEALNSSEATTSVTADAGGRDLLTGRSISAGTTAEQRTFSPAGGLGVLMPAAISLDRLAAAKGEAFDGLYTSLAHDILSDLSGLYEAYATTGDDPALKTIAAREHSKTAAAKTALE